MNLNRISLALAILLAFTIYPAITRSDENKTSEALQLLGATNSFALRFSSCRPAEHNLIPREAFSQRSRSEKKSKVKAFFLSLILPGAGEYYVESRGRARVFFISEALLWAGFFSFRTYGGWLRNDYQVFAATHALANVSGKSGDYFFNLGNYSDIYQYNEDMRRIREYGRVYPVDSFYFWQWDSRRSRLRFDRLRLSSERAHNRATLILGGVLLNHILSAIDALWVTHQYNKALDTSGLRFYFEPGNFLAGEELKFTISRSF